MPERNEAAAKSATRRMSVPNGARARAATEPTENAETLANDMWFARPVPAEDPWSSRVLRAFRSSCRRLVTWCERRWNVSRMRLQRPRCYGSPTLRRRWPSLPGRGVSRWTRDFPAVFSRAPDRARPRAFPRRHALRSPRPRRLSRGMPPTQGAVQTWEVARRVRRLFRGGRVIHLGAGHGLLAQIMLILDDSSPEALVVDKTLPPSAAKVREELSRAWPRLSGRVTFVANGLDDVAILPTDVVVSSHACGALADRVLERAVGARARVAVLPCCHDLAVCDAGDLAGWVEAPVAIDILRAVRLQGQGYRIWTQTIPSRSPAESPPAGRPYRGSPSTHVISCARAGDQPTPIDRAPTGERSRPAFRKT